MSEQIAASSNSILELTKEINNCLKKILKLNSDLSSQLAKLGNTFQDEGYYVIHGYVTGAQNRVRETAPDLKIVMEKLLEYADLLRKSENNIQ